MQKFHDITIPLQESTIPWPGEAAFKREVYSSFERGDRYEASKLTMGSHLGTHIDAPAHFVRGAATIESLPFEVLIGEAKVVELDVEKEITAEDLKHLELAGNGRVLFKTRNSKLYQHNRFSPNYVYLTADAARYLVEAGIKLVGIDYLSIAEFHAGDEVHQILLTGGVVVLETINLSDIEPGEYELICLPLKIVGGDGSPARAVLREI